ncbi:hypothetical protein COCOBI_13-0410 [Coccomyxa sp. Obi]|nr:hypothetical protein COCOBI_13-0410 [Coccomyxa sp. Obi]
MKTFVKGVCSFLILLVTLRLSACATASFNITRTGGAILGPFPANSVSGGIQAPYSPASGGAQLVLPSFSPVTIEAPLSAADNTLIQTLVTGGRVQQVDIGFYVSAANAVQTFPPLSRKITLNQVVIPSYKDANDEANGPVTTFTMLFSKYTDTTYQLRSSSDAVTKTYTTTYDLITQRGTNSAVASR